MSEPEPGKFVCAVCDGTFDLPLVGPEWADAEAERLWGVANASTDPNMVKVCRECFRGVLAWYGKQEAKL